jgi:manganese/iron transport system permease protein
MLELVAEPLSWPFMQRALIEIVLIGALCGLVGTFVVLRGLAFIGDALVHAVFPGVVLSYLAGASIMLGAFAFGGLTALGIGLLARNRRVSHDSAIGVIFVSFFAIGVVLISRERGFRQDLSSLLFGNILGISWDDILITAVAGAVIVVVVLALLKELVLVSFDSALAHANGYPVFGLDLLLLLLMTATVVLSLQTVGNLLILALLVTPAATARLLSDRFGLVVCLSVLVAVVSGVAGLYVSYYAGTSAGATIVLVAATLFLASLVFAPQHGWLSQRLMARRGQHHAHHFHPEGEDVEVH